MLEHDMQHLKDTKTTMGMQAKVHELIMQVWGLGSGLDLFFLDTKTTMGMQPKVHELIMQVWGLGSGLDLLFLFLCFFDRYQTIRAMQDPPHAGSGVRV